MIKISKLQVTDVHQHNDSIRHVIPVTKKFPSIQVIDKLKGKFAKIPLKLLHRFPSVKPKYLSEAVIPTNLIKRIKITAQAQCGYDARCVLFNVDECDRQLSLITSKNNNGTKNKKNR